MAVTQTNIVPGHSKSFFSKNNGTIIQTDSEMESAKCCKERVVHPGFKTTTSTKWHIQQVYRDLLKNQTTAAEDIILVSGIGHFKSNFFVILRIKFVGHFKDKISWYF